MGFLPSVAILSCGLFAFLRHNLCRLPVYLLEHLCGLFVLDLLVLIIQLGSLLYNFTLILCFKLPNWAAPVSNILLVIAEWIAPFLRY